MQTLLDNMDNRLAVYRLDPFFRQVIETMSIDTGLEKTECTAAVLPALREFERLVAVAKTRVLADV